MTIGIKTNTYDCYSSHSFGEQFSQKKWTKEVAGQREILAAYGGVHLEDVRGMRAPFLSVCTNKPFFFLIYRNNGFAFKIGWWQ